MNVPEDYVASILQQALNDKIDSMCLSQKELKDDIREDIQNLKTDLKEELRQIRIQLKEFKDTCAVDMNSHNHRLRTLEEAKWKLYAFGGAVAATAAFIFNYIFKR